MGGRRIAVFLVVVSLFVGVVPKDPGALAQDAGSSLAQEVTATDPAEGGTLALESVTSFDPAGGEAIFEPGTSSEERFSYQGVDTSANYLVGVSRSNPSSHPPGSFVAVVLQSNPAPSPSGDSSPSPETPSAAEPSPTDSPEDSPSSSDTEPQAAVSNSTRSGTTSSGGGLDPVCVFDVQICIPDVDPIDVGPAIQDILRIIDTACPNLQCPDTVVGEVYGIIVSVCGPYGALGCEQMTMNTIFGIIDTYCYNLQCGQEAIDDVSAIVYGLLLQYCGGGGGLLDCEHMVANVVTGVLAQVCPNGIASCADPTINWLNDFIIRLVCPSGSIGTCVSDLQQDVNDQVTFVVGVANGLINNQCPNGIATCADPTINWITDLLLGIVCPSGSIGMCVGEVQQKVYDQVTLVVGIANGLINNSCPNGIATCADPTINWVRDLVMGVVCPSGSIGMCVGEVQQKVYDQATFVVGIANGLINNSCPNGIATCADPTINWVRGLVMGIVCPSGSIGMCVGELQQKVYDQVDFIEGVAVGLVGTLCKDSSSATSGAEDCVYMVMNAVNKAIYDTCGSYQTSGCEKKVIDLVNGVIDSVCNDSALGTTGPEECTGMVIEAANKAIYDACGTYNTSGCEDQINDLIKDLVDTVCNDASTSTTGPEECTGMVIEEANKAMMSACGSNAAVTCVNNLLASVDDYVSNTCNGWPSDYPTAESAASSCIDMVMGHLNWILTTACQSTDAATCAQNLVQQLNEVLVEACGPIETRSSAAGLHPCVDLVTQLVNDAMVIACQSGDPATCAAILIQKINDTVVGVCGPIETRSAATGVHPCVDMVALLVDDLMTRTCQTTDAAACVAYVLGEVQALIVQTCQPVPVGASSSSSSVASHPCEERVIEAIEGVIRTFCGSVDVLVCVTSAAQAITGLVQDVCGSPPVALPPELFGGSTAASASSGCTEKMMGVVDYAVAWACDAEAITCVFGALDEVRGTIVEVCGLGGWGADASAPCASKLLDNAVVPVDGGPLIMLTPEDLDAAYDGSPVIVGQGYVPSDSGGDPSNPGDSTEVGHGSGLMEVEDPRRYPYRLVVSIDEADTLQNDSVCSGWSLGHETVPTAAHCVMQWHQEENRRVATYHGDDVIPGRDGDSSDQEPFGRCEIRNAYTNYAYWSTGLPAYDYAAIKVVDTCDIGRRVGWTGMYDTDYETFGSRAGEPARISGYPGLSEHPDPTQPNTQWRSVGRITYGDRAMYRYDMHARRGHSGAPVYHNEADGGCCPMSVMGIHHGNIEDTYFGGYSEAGIRITSDRAAWFTEIRSWD